MGNGRDRHVGRNVHPWGGMRFAAPAQAAQAERETLEMQCCDQQHGQCDPAGRILSERGLRAGQCGLDLVEHGNLHRFGLPFCSHMERDS